MFTETGNPSHVLTWLVTYRSHVAWGRRWAFLGPAWRMETARVLIPLGAGGGEGGCVLDDLVTFELLTKYFTIAF